MAKIKHVLIDMDCILVDMLQTWLDRYNEATGERIAENDITEWEIRKFIKEPAVLDKVLESSGFFRHMPIMPGADEYFQKLIDNKEFDVTIVTQPPRKADWAIRDKRCWLRDHFPDFEQMNVVFAHKKYLIRGDLLFDDRASNVLEWKQMNPQAVTATIEYKYNRGNVADWKFKKETAWKKFYEKLMEHNKNSK